MGPLRVAVVGHGLIGSQRAAALHALAQSEPVTLAATVDPAPRADDLYDGVPHLERVQALDPESFDAAVVALPHDLATPTATSLLEQGKPVLVEKPLGLTGHEAEAIAARAEPLERPSFVGYNYRFLPHVLDLRAAIAAGKLGKLRSVDMLIGHGGHPDSAASWKLSPQRAGGGVLLDPGVHLLDLLLLLDPELAPAHVAGTRGFWGTGIEEDLVAVLEHGDLLATLRVSHIRWVNTLRIEVVGEDGYAILEGRGGNYGPMTSRVGSRWGWHDDPQGRSQRETETAHDHGADNRSLDDELRAVVGRWLGDGDGAAQPATMAEGRRVTDLVESMYALLDA